MSGRASRRTAGRWAAAPSGFRSTPSSRRGCAAAGVPPRLSAVPRPLARALLPLPGLVVAPLRRLSENAYIFYEPYVVDHSRYAAAFRDHATPLADAIREPVRCSRAHAAPGTALAEPASARA